MWYNLQGEGKGKNHIRCGTEKKSFHLADGIAILLVEDFCIMACHSLRILSIRASATLSITGPFAASILFFSFSIETEKVCNSMGYRS
jgi:hypothetical protein